MIFSLAMHLPRNVKYYDMHGEMDRGFLHPGGREATEKLLSLLPSLHEQSTVVEIGCGVGETAKLILERFPCSYVGIDSSSRMLDRARARLSVHSNRVTLIKRDLQIDHLPLSAESVSAIIAESVFAILNPGKIFSECYYVLKKGGVVAWSDRIWGESVSREDRLKVNQISKKMLGFHAAPDDLATAEDWKKLVEGKGFRMIMCEKLFQSSPTELPQRSSTITRIFKIVNLLTNPRFFPYWYNDQAVEKKYRELWAKMENWIFVARKV